VGYLAKAAAQHHLDAFVGLGYCYSEGIGVAQNRLKGIEWFEKAARLKNDYALNKMGCIRQEENKLREALDYFLEAANRDFDLAKINAARIALQDKKLFHHFPVILKLLHPLAEKEHPEAELFLASIYLLPDGRHYNVEEAFKWLQRSFLHGSKEAARTLINFVVSKGQFSKKSLSILTGAAAQGNRDAFMSLGSLALSDPTFLLGTWAEKAASEGDIMVQCSIASLYIQRGHYSRARSIFQHILEKKPTNSEEEQALVFARQMLTE